MKNHTKYNSTKGAKGLLVDALSYVRHEKVNTKEPPRARSPPFQREHSSGTSAPQYSLLADSYADVVLREYNRRVKLDYADNPFLDVLSLMTVSQPRKFESVVAGSNPFAISLINELDSVRGAGRRSAGLHDIEQLLLQQRDNSAEILNVAYMDLALFLRRKPKPTTILAMALDMQLRELGFRGDRPAVIPLDSLSLRLDNQSPFGLSFCIRDTAEIYHTQVLDEKGETYDSSNYLEPKSDLLSYLCRSQHRAVALHLPRIHQSDLTRVVYNFNPSSYLRKFANIFLSGAGGRIVLV